MLDFIVFLMAIVALVAFSALLGGLAIIIAAIIKEEFKDGN